MAGFKFLLKEKEKGAGCRWWRNAAAGGNGGLVTSPIALLAACEDKGSGTQLSQTLRPLNIHNPTCCTCFKEQVVEESRACGRQREPGRVAADRGGPLEHQEGVSGADAQPVIAYLQI